MQTLSLFRLFLLLSFAPILTISSESHHERPKVVIKGFGKKNKNLKCENTQNAVVDQTIQYTTKLSRFKKPLFEYNPCNTAALLQIDINVTLACGRGDANLPPPPRFDQAIPISGIDPISNKEALLAYILVSKKLNMVILSLTGTQTAAEWISDFDFPLTAPTELNNYQPGVLVENGFYQLYLAIFQEIRSEIARLVDNKKVQFIISGHSLGGALVTLAAFDLSDYKPIVYSFASPRVGNPTFAALYNSISPLNNTWRVFNTEDVVTYLPPPELPLGILLPVIFIYEHVGNPVPFTLNYGTILSNHVDAYNTVIINQLPPVNPNGICPNRFDCSTLTCEGCPTSSCECCK